MFILIIPITASASPNMPPRLIPGPPLDECGEVAFGGLWDWNLTEPPDGSVDETSLLGRWDGVDAAFETWNQMSWRPGATVHFLYMGHRPGPSAWRAQDGVNTVTGRSFYSSAVCQELIAGGMILPDCNDPDCNCDNSNVPPTWTPADVCVSSCSHASLPLAVTSHSWITFDKDMSGNIVPGSCSIAEWDIWVNSDIPWSSTELPSQLPGPDSHGDHLQFSLSQVLLHEIGHVLGYVHNGTSPSEVMELMNPRYPGSGDAGTGILQPTAGITAALIEDFPTGGGSPLPNYAVWRFWPYGGAFNRNPFLVREAWTDESSMIEHPRPSPGWAFPDDWEIWEKCVNQNLDGDGFYRPPTEFFVSSVNPTASVVVRLGLTQDALSCDEVVLWERVMVFPHGEMTEVKTAAWPDVDATIPSGTTPGIYRLCALIDPYDTVAESSEDDNLIVSEKTFIVENEVSNYGLCCTWGT